MSEATRIGVRLVAADRYSIEVRGHVVETDQPVESGGGDAAPTPTELFVASLASCTAHYAARFLRRHNLSDAGLAVDARFTMSSDRPARVAQISIDVSALDLPPHYLEAFRRVVEHCTVHNSIVSPPAITIGVNQAVGAGR